MIDFKLPIILIGFKHVGKSCLGKALAKKLRLDFTDLDSVLESRYLELTDKKLNCRGIVHQHGIEYFRLLESKILKEVMGECRGVLALGGGTPLTLENQKLISQGTVIQIKARKGMVFERIMITGRPAFFPEGEEAYEAFIRIWNEREPIYQQLANFEVENSGSIDESVGKILQALQEKALA
jgi:shikimate kinase